MSGAGGGAGYRSWQAGEPALLRIPSPSGMLPLQPSVHFAEDTLVRCEDDEEEERRFSAGKQRLIRKDTPHYKKHFRIAQLPQPEAVVALLQGLNTDGGAPVGVKEPRNNGWDEVEPKNEAPAAPPSVKVGSWARLRWDGGARRQCCVPASQGHPHPCQWLSSPFPLTLLCYPPLG